MLKPSALNPKTLNPSTLNAFSAEGVSSIPRTEQLVSSKQTLNGLGWELSTASVTEWGQCPMVKV